MHFTKILKNVLTFDVKNKKSPGKNTLTRTSQGSGALKRHFITSNEVYF